MQTTVLPGPLGAIALHGVDTRSLGPEEMREIKRLVYRHKLVVVRGQRLQPAELVATSRRLGRVEPYFQSNYHHPEHPEIFVSSNVPVDGRKVGVAGTGRYWHSDYQFLPRPFSIVVLSPQVVPPAGRGTLFVDMGEALGRLPAQLAERLRGATSITDPRLKYKVRLEDLDKALDELLVEASQLVSPLRRRAVVEHPVTGQPILYMSPGFTVGLEGLSYEQNRGLMRELWKRVLDPDHVTEYSWREGDLLLWDNISLIHAAAPAPEGRVMQYRVTVYDDAPGAVPAFLGEPPPLKPEASADGFGLAWNQPWVLGAGG